MIKIVLELNTKPVVASKAILESDFADVVSNDRFDFGEGKEAIIIVLEKYYIRVSGRATLTIIIENSSGKTVAKLITAGVARGRFMDFDWGASDSFADNAREVLSRYIVNEFEEE